MREREGGRERRENVREKGGVKQRVGGERKEREREEN